MFRQFALATALIPLAALIPALHAQAPCQLFGTDASGGNLLSVDASTGAGTVLGFSFNSFPALAMDPTTGILYGGMGQGTPLLYTIDPSDGTATLIGDTGLGFASIGALEFSPDGTLYASVNLAGDGGTGSDHLVTIDKATAAVALVGSYGTCTGVVVPATGAGTCTIEGIEAIAFDDSGTLWAALSERGAAGAAGLYTIDETTGVATFVASFQDGSGRSPSGGVVSLQYCSCDGKLYGGTATAVSPATDGGLLLTVDDTATGLFTYVSATSATGGSSLGGLARLFAASASVVRNGTGCNPVGYAETSPAILGGTWKTTVDIVTPGATVSALGITDVGTDMTKIGIGEVLIDVSLPLISLDIAAGTHCIAIPDDCSLLGLTFFTQAATFSPGNLQLNNAIDVTFGTF